MIWLPRVGGALSGVAGWDAPAAVSALFAT
jgi:hypothetical protein